MFTSRFILGASIFCIIKGAIFSTIYAVKLAENFHLSKFIVGFIIIAIISILPETFISLSAVLEGQPELGLGTLLGSNVTDLTLVFAIIILFSGRKDIKVESKILKINKFYPFFMLLPLLLGLDAHYGRVDGIVLIVMGIFFYYMTYQSGVSEFQKSIPQGEKVKNIVYLLGSIGLLLIGSHFAVEAGIDIANAMGVSSALIGLLVIGIGTAMPELVFAFQSVRKYNDDLAVGDILGTVLADATIVVGMIALISPFSFPPEMFYSTGIFMVLASIMLGYFMYTDRVMSKQEGRILMAFWLMFVLTEYILNVYIHVG